MRSKRPSDHSDSAGLGMHQGEPRSLGLPECSTSNPQGAPQGRLGSVLADAGRPKKDTGVVEHPHRHPQTTKRHLKGTHGSVLGASWGPLDAPGDPLGRPEATLSLSATTLDGLRKVFGGSKKRPRAFFVDPRGSNTHISMVLSTPTL